MLHYANTNKIGEKQINDISFHPWPYMVTLSLQSEVWILKPRPTPYWKLKIEKGSNCKTVNERMTLTMRRRVPFQATSRMPRTWTVCWDRPKQGTFRLSNASNKWSANICYAPNVVSFPYFFVKSHQNMSVIKYPPPWIITLLRHLYFITI